MPLTIPTIHSDFKTTWTKRLSHAWKITRADATVFKFTSFDRKVALDDGLVYTPVGGFDQSASRRSDSMRDHDTEFRGVITAASITDDDLRAGLFREAMVEEYVFDWRCPWAGPVVTHVYWIAKTMFDGEKWQAECTGPMRFLKTKIGDVYGRTCRWDFGDSNCAFNVASVTLSGRLVLAMEDGLKRRIILADPTGPPGFGTFTDEAVFDDGKITFTSGANNGLTGIVKSYRNADKRIELQVAMPYDIASGDAFDIVQGCDKLLGTCRDRYSNIANNGGFPYIPGQDRVLQTPASKTK